MLIISHRGYHADVPENTIEAFERALSMGVHGIETDIRLSAEGTPILFHDRLVGAQREISSLTTPEIEKLVGHKIATLADLEDLIARSDPTQLWNLEIKEAAALESVLSLVDRLRGTARFLITSFKHPVVRKASERTEAECGFLVSHYPVLSLEGTDWPSAGANLSTIVWNYEEADAALIRQAGRRGFRSFVYGLISPQDHDEAATWRIDGIITDNPHVLL